MATPVFCCGFECGQGTGNNIHFDSRSGTLATETTTIRSGVRSVRCNPTAGVGFQYRTGLTASDRWVGRFYVRFATLPSADTSLAEMGTGASDSPCVRFKQSDSKIYAAVGTTFGASGVSVTTGVWYRIDFDFNISAGGSDTCDVQVDGSPCGQATAAGLASTFSVFSIGIIEICTADAFFDDLILSNTAADYPLGAGYIKSYIPNADGTHNVAGANDFEFADGTDITNATTTAYTVIARRPLNTTESADYIEGAAPPNSTDYVEWQYEDSTEGAAPRAVEAIIAVTDAGGAGTNDITVTLREHAGGTSGDIFAGTGNRGSTVNYARAHFATVPGTSDAWTETKFNALRSRFLVSDHSPDPRINAAMLEAEFVEASGPVDATITGVTGTATSAGIAGAVQIARAIAGVTATSDAAGIVGSVATVRIVSITGVTATASAAGIAGSVVANQVISASITGVTATASAEGIAGSVATVRIVAIAGTTATADAEGIAGTVTAVRIVSITGVTATATAEGIAGTVDTGAIVNASITGVTATASADGIAGTVTAVRIVSITGTTASATAAGISGTVTAVRIVAISGVTGTATAAGVAGTVATVNIVSISGVTATAAAEGIAGVVFSVPIATITGVTATASAAGIAGSVTAVRIVSIAGVTATASAEGSAGSVQVARSISGATATASAEGIAGAVQIARSITGVSAEATALGIAGVLSAVRIASISGTTGTATAAGIAGVLLSSGAPTPMIIALLGSYVATQDIVGSVLTPVLAGSYSTPTDLDGSVLFPVISGSYIATQDLEGSV